MGLSSTPITPVAGTPNFYPPQSGTGVLAADVQAGLQATADWIAYLNARRPVVSFRANSSGVSTEHFSDHTGYTTSTVTYVDVAGALVGDIIAVDFCWVGRFEAASPYSGHYGYFKPVITEDYGGTNANLGTLGSIVKLGAVDPGYTYALYHPCSFTYSFAVTVAGTCRISLGGTVSNAGDDLSLSTSWSARAIRFPT